jgi:uncharacterized lipoprotein YmbA
MKMWQRSLGVLICTCLLLVGCGSTPSSRFYNLSATPAPAALPSQLSVVVGPVSVPDAVDRPEIVVRTGPNQVRPEEFNRWASPLHDQIARAVANNLVAILGTAHVTLSSQILGTGAQYRVVIEVQQFESAPGEAATLDAIWSVSRTRGGRSITRRTTLREPAPQLGYDALVAAHSRAITRLSRDIAGALLALNRGGR